MANEFVSKLKTDWSDIPTWVKIGTLVGGAVLFLLSKRGGSTGTTIASTQSPGNTLTGGVLNTTPISTTGDTTGTRNAPTGTDTTNNNPNNIGLPSAAYNPQPIGNNGLSPSQNQLQQNDINKLLGPYGGTPVSVTNPFSSITGWSLVTDTQYSGGGNVLNLGVAQPAPQPGQVIPPAVQGSVIYHPGTSIPDWTATVNNAYQYPQNFSPGMVQPQAVNNPLIATAPVTPSTPSASPNYDLLSQESAKQSAAYQASVASGGYTSGGQATFNASHPLSMYQ